MKKISIITPCLNAEKYIEETVRSVTEQAAVLSNKVELEYIICDGNSTDKTLDIINALKSKYIKIISNRDSGMYAALSKGIKLVSGDITAYINAGDYYNKYAFDIITEIFEKKQAHWLTGYIVTYNEQSYLVDCRLPYRYRKRFFTCGYYGTKLPFIQQESTFWSSSLNELIDCNYLSKLKYAGDFYIWLQFSKAQELKIVESYLGGFRKHRGQISENLAAYHTEMQQLVLPANISDFILYCFDKGLWYLPSKIKKTFNQNGIFRFNHELQEWI